MPHKTVRELLLDYTIIINKHGVASHEEMQFCKDNETNTEFLELAKTVRWLNQIET